MIGIVTVLFHGEDLLQDFFSSLARQKGIDFKLYLIDNSPNKQAFQRVIELNKKHKFDIDMIFNGANLGVAAGNNIGITKALADGCDYVLLSNYDININQDDAILKLQEHAGVDNSRLYVPKIYYYGRRVFWYAGGHIDYLRGISPHYGDGEEDVGQRDISGIMKYAPTCFMLIHKSIFHKIGMMDEKYFVYLDDTDFVVRCARQNIPIYYLADSVVEHKVSQTTGGNWSEFSIRQTNKNRIYFLRKNKGNLHATICSLYLSLFFIKHWKKMWPLRITYFSSIRDGWML